jgi:acyl transferase domain-containing protein
MRKTVWMFSGQGSQYLRMGRDLYESDPVFREKITECDREIRRLRGDSILDVIYPKNEPPRNSEFDDILYTHPSLFSIQYSLAQTLLRRGWRPDLLLGYSLGEFVAAAVGGAISLENVLAVLLEQARLLNNSAEPGTMLAILSSPEMIKPGDPVFANTWIAARNFGNHFVLSGGREAIARVQNYLRSREITNQRLPVKFAFHSPGMDSIAQEFKKITSDMNMQGSIYPIVSATKAAELPRLTPDFFWDVVREPVQFDRTVASLEARGKYRYIDLGPTGTLATFLKYALPRGSSSTFHSTMTPFNRTNENLRAIETLLAQPED